MIRTAPVFLVGALLSTMQAYAQIEIPLYDGAIPNALIAPDRESIRDPKDPHTFLMDVSRPTLTVYALTGARVPTAAVLIFPGGSYRGVSIVKEGHDVAKAFNERGVAAFVVKYRTPDDAHMTNRSTGPLQDAQQAIRLVRERAGEWNIDPKRVGAVGFSAGGHLVATLATRFDTPVDKSASAGNLRPDFVVLLYPVISMYDGITHSLSRSNLLGDAPTQEAIATNSVELHVKTDTPPMFLMHAADDKSVSVENTLRLFAALRANNIETELHVYPHGGHGFGLYNATTPDKWFDRCANWLKSRHLLNE